jgi:hypothetical protein
MTSRPNSKKSGPIIIEWVHPILIGMRKAVRSSAARGVVPGTRSSRCKPLQGVERDAPVWARNAGLAHHQITGTP